MNNSLIHRWAQQKAKTTNKKVELEESQADKQADLETDLNSNDANSSHIDSQATNENSLVDEKENSKQSELPAIETLGEDSDYSMFMSSEIDESLQKLALRKLFKAPFYNIRDGLNDYDEDFSTFEELGDIITSDMKYHQERKKTEQEEKERLKQQAKSAEQAEEVEEHANKKQYDDSEVNENTEIDSESKINQKSNNLHHKDNLIKPKPEDYEHKPDYLDALALYHHALEGQFNRDKKDKSDNTNLADNREQHPSGNFESSDTTS